MQLPDRGSKGPSLKVLSVVVPALDEADCIEATINQLRRNYRKKGLEVDPYLEQRMEEARTARP